MDKPPIRKPPVRQPQPAQPTPSQQAPPPASSPPERTTKSKRRSGMPLSLIALLLFVAIFGVVAYLQIKEKRACENSFKAIDILIKPGLSDLPREDVPELMIGNPKLYPHETSDVFIWRGVLKNYKLTIEYRKDRKGQFVEKVKAET